MLQVMWKSLKKANNTSIASQNGLGEMGMLDLSHKFMRAELWLEIH
jgi:hypothetical protein